MCGYDIYMTMICTIMKVSMLVWIGNNETKNLEWMP